MDEINKIESVINFRADKRLEADIKDKPLANWGLMNIYIIIPDDLGSVDSHGETKGKRTARLDDIKKIIDVGIFKKYQDEYRKNERNRFLSEIAKIKEYLQE